MSIKPTDTGEWMVDVRPQGRDGPRVRKKFPTKNEAQQFERWVIATQHNKGWMDKPKDRRPFSELIDLWWAHYGQTLKAGRCTYLALIAFDAYMKHPRADQITHELFSDYRAARLTEGISPRTINNMQIRVSGVFTALAAAGKFQGDNPMKGLKRAKTKRSQMAFLTNAQIAQLLDETHPNDLRAVRLALATGARFGEVESLLDEHIIKNRVTYVDTKNGKDRTVPISPELFKDIKGSIVGRRVFPKLSYTRVRQLLKKLIPDLPNGQATHVFRHTFGSHFMMNGGNILALQKILGHATIEQTMTYAHFAPDYLLDAVRFNPLEYHQDGNVHILPKLG
ncbi:tyrosine-type recombinase/integrase [Serratia marcescens]|nr:tyrosine-type recombinase/integrase [Serratia marcescens]